MHRFQKRTSKNDEIPPNTRRRKNVDKTYVTPQENYVRLYDEPKEEDDDENDFSGDDGYETPAQKLGPEKEYDEPEEEEYDEPEEEYDEPEEEDREPEEENDESEEEYDEPEEDSQSEVVPWRDRDRKQGTSDNDFKKKQKIFMGKFFQEAGAQFAKGMFKEQAKMFDECEDKNAAFQKVDAQYMEELYHRQRKARKEKHALEDERDEKAFQIIMLQKERDMEKLMREDLMKKVSMMKKK